MINQVNYTGETPKVGYVGYVNVTETKTGMRFTVRSEGVDSYTAAYEVPFEKAEDMLVGALMWNYEEEPEVAPKAWVTAGELKALLSVIDDDSYVYVRDTKQDEDTVIKSYSLQRFEDGSFELALSPLPNFYDI